MLTYALTYAGVCYRETREEDLREAISPHAQILGRIKFVGKSSALVTLASAGAAQAVCDALEASQRANTSTNGNSGLVSRSVPLRLLASPGVCRRMLTYADVCRRMLTYADAC